MQTIPLIVAWNKLGRCFLKTGSTPFPLKQFRFPVGKMGILRRTPLAMQSVTESFSAPPIRPYSIVSFRNPFY